MKQKKLLKYNVKFMVQHPLRDKLSKKDWKRIQAVIDRRASIDMASLEEINAGHDVFFDGIAGMSQTHLGVYVLQ